MVKHCYRNNAELCHFYINHFPDCYDKEEYYTKNNMSCKNDVLYSYNSVLCKVFVDNVVVVCNNTRHYSNTSNHHYNILRGSFPFYKKIFYINDLLEGDTVRDVYDEYIKEIKAASKLKIIKPNAERYIGLVKDYINYCKCFDFKQKVTKKLAVHYEQCKQYLINLAKRQEHQRIEAEKRQLEQRKLCKEFLVQVNKKFKKNFSRYYNHLMNDYTLLIEDVNYPKYNEVIKNNKNYMQVRECIKNLYTYHYFTQILQRPGIMLLNDKQIIEDFVNNSRLPILKSDFVTVISEDRLVTHRHAAIDGKESVNGAYKIALFLLNDKIAFETKREILLGKHVGPFTIGNLIEKNDLTVYIGCHSFCKDAIEMFVEDYEKATGELKEVKK